MTPSQAAHFPSDSPSLSYGFSGEGLVTGPDGATIAIVGAATVAGTVAGAQIARRSHRIIAEGGRVGGTHRAAVFGGVVLAGGTLGALAAIPLLGGPPGAGAYMRVTW